MKIPDYELRKFYIQTLAKRWLSIYVHERQVSAMKEISDAYPEFAKYVNNRIQPIVNAMEKDQSPNGYRVSSENVDQYQSWHSWDYKN